jgi:hypothetical protein
VAINSGISSFTLTFDRSSWTNPAATMNVQIDLSGDGGKTWNTRDKLGYGWCGFSSSGSAFDKTKPSTILTCKCDPLHLCDPKSSQNHIKGTVTITGAAITTSGTIVAK